MKKLIVMGIVVVMLMGLAVAASADANVWFANLRASNDILSKTGASSAKFGFKTAGSDTFAKLTSGYDAAGAPEVEFYDATGNHALPTNPTGTLADSYRWYVAQVVQPAATAVPYNWNFQVAGAANSTVYLTLWNPAGATSNVDDTGTFAYTLKLYTGTAASKGTLAGTLTQAGNGTWTAADGIGGQFLQVPVALGATGKSLFVLEATVPEPGSMLAMFSGLVGLVGFGIRRRK